MRKQIIIPVLMLATMMLGSCSVIEGIFKAGFWAGFIFVVIIIVVIIAILRAMFKGK